MGTDQWLPGQGVGGRFEALYPDCSGAYMSLYVKINRVIHQKN